MWAGIALGVAAALEVPALLLIGRLSNRLSHLGLIATSCLAGIGYYLGLAFATGPIMVVGLQLLNTWSFAGIAGIGLPLFQHMIPRLGLSTSLYMNTRRIGSIVSGPIIAIGSLTVLGQRGIFLTSAVSHPHRPGHHRHCQPNTPVTIWAPSRRPGGRSERSQSLVPCRRLEPDRLLIRDAPGEGSFRLMVAPTGFEPAYRFESAKSGLFR
jgi:MFS family permease